MPTALTGIITGIVLGVARVAGETAPLLILVGYTPNTNGNLFSGFQGALPRHDLRPGHNLGNTHVLVNGHPATIHYAADRMWGAALTLIIIVMALNLVARLIGRLHPVPVLEKALDMAKRIDAKDLNIYYGKFLAVSDAPSPSSPGAVTAFIGPSGCGKSTVLRTLNRMHEVIAGARVEGDVLLDGDNIYAPASIRSTSAARSAWSSSGPTRSRRCPSTTTSPPG